MTDLSLVIPVYNERDALADLLREVREALAALPGTKETVLVDDGSADGSGERLDAEAAADPSLAVLHLDRNHGLTSALDAGFRRAAGRIIASMDADLQNDPRDLGRLLAALETHDFACGVRARREDPFLKRMSSKIANGVRRAFTGDRFRDVTCPLKAFRRECLEAFPRFNGAHRFYPLFAEWHGFKVAEVEVSHRPRRFGEGKYHVGNRIFRTIRDLRGVLWLRKRRLSYRIAREEGPSTNHE